MIGVSKMHSILERGKIGVASKEFATTPRGLTLNQGLVDWRAAMQSTEFPRCPVCNTPVKRRSRTYCSHSCSSISRGAKWRGVICSADSCERTPSAYGYCEKHWLRLKRNGHLGLIAPGKGVPEVDRFWGRVAKLTPSECWEWTGELQNKGYGVFYTYADGGRTTHLAHRYSLALVEDLVDGLICLHSCDNPKCVNPSHLRQGTQRENMRDALAKGRMNMSGLEIGRRLSVREARERRRMLDGAA